MERTAVFRGVVEAGAHFPAIGAVITGETRVRSLLEPDAEDLCPEFVDGSAVGLFTGVDAMPHLFAGGAVGLLVARAELGDRIFLPFPFDYLCADDFIELDADLVFFGLQGKVFFAEDFGFDTHLTQWDFHPFGDKPAFKQFLRV